MTSKSVLLRSAAIGAVIALSFTASAQAATHKRVRGEADAASNQQLLDQVQALSAQVQALQARLDAQASATQAAQAQATQAQATAAETQTQVQQIAADKQSVEDRLDNVPSQVLQTLSEVPKPKPSWAENTTVSGRMYFNLSYIDQESNGQKVPATGTGFDIKRFYIGIDHRFNDVYSADVTTDFQYSSAIGATELYLKKAYLKANYAPWLNIRLGADDMPWIPFVEGVYGYRHIEQTLTDRTKYGTSSDWGLHAGGNLGKYVQYEVAVVDGAGYKAPLRSKNMDFEGRINLNYEGFILAVGGYTGKLGKEAQNTVGIYHTASRFNALAAYTKGPIRLGVEYFSASDWNNVTTAASDRSEGWSGFGSYAFNAKWSVFGRYDWVKPTKTTANSRDDNYFNVGIQYEPAKIVDLALVYKRDKVENGTLSTGNGTIGGSIDGSYDEFGLFGQLRF